jgi:hypothetical protein
MTVLLGSGAGFSGRLSMQTRISRRNLQDIELTSSAGYQNISVMYTVSANENQQRAASFGHFAVVLSIALLLLGLGDRDCGLILS